MFLWNGIQCFPVIFLAASQIAPAMCYLYCIVSVYCIFAVNEVYQIKFPATVKKIDISRFNICISIHSTTACAYLASFIHASHPKLKISEFR